MLVRQSARPPRAALTELRNAFCEAHADALLDRKTVAAGLNRSVGWLEALATKGGGPAFHKVGTHRVLYRKTDVIAWFDSYARRVASTSDLTVNHSGSTP